MAVTHQNDLAGASSDNRCAVMFCLTWVGFFVLVGALTFVASFF